MTVLVQNVIRHTPTRALRALTPHRLRRPLLRERRSLNLENANVPGETGPARSGPERVLLFPRSVPSPTRTRSPARAAAKTCQEPAANANRGPRIRIRMLGRGKVSRFREPRAARNPRCRGDAWMRSETEKERRRECIPGGGCHAVNRDARTGDRAL